MIIVNQDRTETLILENIMNIEITNCDEDRFGIFAGFIVGRDDNYRDLGYYRTEKRAKEVMEKIIVAFSDFSYFKNATEKEKEFIKEILKVQYSYFDTFEMPKE